MRFSRLQSSFFKSLRLRGVLAVAGLASSSLIVQRQVARADSDVPPPPIPGLPMTESLASLKKKKAKKPGSTGAASASAAPVVAESPKDFQHIQRTTDDVLSFRTWNGVDFRFAYSPLPAPRSQDEMEKMTKSIQLSHHLQFGSPSSVAKQQGQQQQMMMMMMQDPSTQPTAEYDLTAVMQLGPMAAPSHLVQAQLSARGMNLFYNHTFFRHNERFSPLDLRVTALKPFGGGGDGGMMMMPEGFANIETEYKANDYNLSTAYSGREQALSLAFVQAYGLRNSMNLDLGVQLQHAFGRQTSLSYAGQLRNKSMNEVWGVIYAPSQSFNLGYKRSFPSPSSGSQFSWATNFEYSSEVQQPKISAGLSYEMRNFFDVKASVDSTFRVASSLDVMVGPGINVSLCSDIITATNKYVLGVGLSMG